MHKMELVFIMFVVEDFALVHTTVQHIPVPLTHAQLLLPLVVTVVLASQHMLEL